MIIRDWPKIRFRFPPKIWVSINICFQRKNCENFGLTATICIPKTSYRPSDFFNIVHWYELDSFNRDTLYLLLWMSLLVVMIHKGLNTWVQIIKQAVPIGLSFKDAFHVLNKSCRFNNSRKFLIWTTAVLRIALRKF